MSNSSTSETALVASDSGLLTGIEEPAGKKRKSKRILELDAIRALSCLNLLLFHFTWVYQHKHGGFATAELGFTFPYGKYGVQLFFMLSGLVNAMTLLSKRKSGEFIVARCIRIFPSYWLVILLNVVLFATVPMFHTTPTIDSTVANLTTMPMLLGYENMEPVTWTLQIEMLFYVFLMALLATGLLDKPVRTMLVAVSVCFVCCTSFTWFKGVYPDSVWNGTFRVVEDLFFMRNMPLFAMGILLNELRSKRFDARWRKWILWGGIVVSAAVFHAIDLRGHNPAATVLMFGLLTASAYGRVPILRWRPLIFISFISYSLYLFHNNLGSALMKLLESWGCPPILMVLLATAFAIAIGAAITYWFEQPLTKRLRVAWSKTKERYTERQGAHSDPVKPSLIKPKTQSPT
ncbi:MAG: acyltransferase family protein [Mariniblastus sp.]